MKVLVALSTILVLGSAQLPPEPEGIKDVATCIYGVGTDAVDEIRRNAKDSIHQLREEYQNVKSLASLDEFINHVTVSRDEIVAHVSAGRYTAALEACKVGGRKFLRKLNTCISEASENTIPKVIKIVSDLRSQFKSLPVTAGIKAAMCIRKI